MASWEDLLDRLRRQDPTVRTSLYDAYHHRLYYILLKAFPLATTIHHQDCMENGIVVAFLELFQKPEIFDPARSRSQDPLLTLLAGMARRRTIDCLRKLKRDVLTREQLQSIDDDSRVEIMRVNALLGERSDMGLADDPVNLAATGGSNTAAVGDAIEALVDGVISPDEFYRRIRIHLDLGALDALVDRLKPRQFVAWFMKYAADFSVREIAQLLKLTEDAVDGLLRRARAILNGKHDAE